MTDPEGTDSIFPLSDKGRAHRTFAQQMKEKNLNTITSIEQMGGAVDVTVARLEHFFDHLVAMGLISNDDRWAEERAWQIDLNRQLREMHQRMTQIRQAAKEEAKRPRLVLPPHMQNGNGKKA